MLKQNELFVSNYCIETIFKYSLMKYLFFINKEGFKLLVFYNFTDIFLSFVVPYFIF